MVYFCNMLVVLQAGLTFSSPLLRPSAHDTRRTRSGAPVKPPDGDGWFDGATVGAAVVRRVGDRWLMWYAGRPNGFPDDVVPIGTGYIGVAESVDGLVWEKIACTTRESHGSYSPR